jgi:mannose-1-phosphate guanylyltransferase/mannose-6-phosphate isomerase
MENRPWGFFCSLYKDNCHIKKIIVYPHKRLSLQSHQFRNEHWIVISGNGKAQIDDIIQDIQEGDSIYIKKTQKHRLINDSKENLEIIEIQTGNYFGEDDIIRYEDDFHRK